jgi:hypothetical protein
MGGLCPHLYQSHMHWYVRFFKFIRFDISIKYRFPVRDHFSHHLTFPCLDIYSILNNILEFLYSVHATRQWRIVLSTNTEKHLFRTLLNGM